MKIALSRKTLKMIFIWILGILIFLTMIILFGFFSSKDRSVLLGSSNEFSHNGTIRTYRQVKPRDKATSVVIGLHGFGDTSRRFAYYTALHNLVDDSTLVLYPDAVRPPEGLKTGWNAGFCCGSGWKTGSDDVGYIVELISNIKETHGQNINVYLTGFSNGAFLAQRVAAEHPDIIDGVAVSSGTIGTIEKRIEPTSPVPILLMHGEQDVRVSFNGGTSANDPEFNWLSFEETSSVWASANRDKAETKTITYPDNAHTWDGWRLLNVWHKQPDASKEVVNFFNSL